MTLGDDVTLGMLEQRRVMIGGRLDPPTVGDAVARLMLLDGQSADPVALVINSPGGPLEDAVGLLDTLRLMRTPVTVDVLGRAHGSAGSVVAACPGRRRLGSTASISLRLEASPPDRRRLGADELERIAEAATDLQRRLGATVGTRAGRPIDWVLDQFERGPVWFGADAVAAGLADELR